MNVLARSALVLSLAMLAAGCASEAPKLAGFATTSSLAVAGPAVGVAATQQQPSAQSYRKTMSDRVLAAIALERVTGLKPDPSRFAE